MAAPSKKNEIFGTIIGTHSVDVMDNVIEDKRTFNLVVDNESMFENATLNVGKWMTGKIYLDVPVRGQSFSSYAIPFVSEFFSKSPARIPVFTFRAFIRAIVLDFVTCGKCIGTFFANLLVIHGTHGTINAKPNSVSIISITASKHFDYFHVDILSKGEY